MRLTAVGEATFEVRTSPPAHRVRSASPHNWPGALRRVTPPVERLTHWQMSLPTLQWRPEVSSKVRHRPMTVEYRLLSPHAKWAAVRGVGDKPSLAGRTHNPPEDQMNRCLAAPSSTATATANRRICTS